MRKRPTIPRLDGGSQTILLVEDIERSVEFYTKSLLLKQKDGDVGRYAEFDTGEAGTLVLVKRDGTIAPLIDPALTDDSVSLTFSIPAEGFDTWKKWFAKCGVPLERETKWVHGGKSLFVRDPDGRRLEFKTPAIVLPPKPGPPVEKRNNDN